MADPILPGAPKFGGLVSAPHPARRATDRAPPRTTRSVALEAAAAGIPPKAEK